MQQQLLCAKTLSALHLLALYPSVPFSASALNSLIRLQIWWRQWSRQLYHILKGMRSRSWSCLFWRSRSRDRSRCCQSWRSLSRSRSRDCLCWRCFVAAAACIAYPAGSSACGGRDSSAVAACAATSTRTRQCNISTGPTRCAGSCAYDSPRQSLDHARCVSQRRSAVYTAGHG